jgi:hypothetical protein
MYGFLYHARVAFTGTKEAFYSKCKSELNSAPQYKLLFEEEFTTERGLLSYKIGEQYMEKKGLLLITRFIIPVGKDFLLFTYIRWGDTPSKIDTALQQSINTVDILIPE